MKAHQTIRLAVVDDDSGFLTVLNRRAAAAGWQLPSVGRQIPAQDLVTLRLDALMVDPALFGDDAWAYLEQVSALLPDLGLVVCTEGSSVSERVRGLRLGVDDWIAKPCHPEEALARIEAVLRRRRRARSHLEEWPVLAGELEIRGDRFQAFVAGEDLGLTRREFELLLALAESPGSTLEREAIYRRVWRYEMAHGDRSVDVFVRKLRQKLARRSPAWRYIHTHFGIGYRFEPEPLTGRPAASSVKSRESVSAS